MSHMLSNEIPLQPIHAATMLLPAPDPRTTSGGPAQHACRYAQSGDKSCSVTTVRGQS
jgi:hypothetical protein